MNDLKGKKILYIITKSNWGGAQKYVHALATAAKANGANVLVALGGTGAEGAVPGALAERLEAAGIGVEVVKSFMRDIRTSRDVEALEELANIMRRFRPDIVHTNSSKAGGLGALAARRAGVRRILFTAHGWPHREPVSPFARIFRWLSSWATIVLSHAAIVVSRADYRHAPVFFSRRKLALIHNGTTAARASARTDARETLSLGVPGLRTDGFWFLMLAELHRNKGVDIAIRAFKELAISRSEAYLVVLGEGEERAALEREIHAAGLLGRVFLRGFVPNAPRYLSAADVFLMPSRKEGLPLALLEAGAAGLPVVASVAGGIPEVITDGTDGLLVRTNDVPSLARAMQRLFEDQGARERLGNALQRRVLKEFSDERMVAETFDLYE